MIANKTVSLLYLIFIGTVLIHTPKANKCYKYHNDPDTCVSEDFKCCATEGTRLYNGKWESFKHCDDPSQAPSGHASFCDKLESDFRASSNVRYSSCKCYVPVSHWWLWFVIPICICAIVGLVVLCCFKVCLPGI